MHIEHDNADAGLRAFLPSTSPMKNPTSVRATDTIAPAQTVAPFIPTNDQTSLRFANPSGPLGYVQNTQPVLVQTPQGSAIVAAPVEQPRQVTPIAIQADLPQDQKAYKENSVPIVSLITGGTGPRKQLTGMPTKENGGIPTENTFMGFSFNSLVIGAVIIGVIIFLIKK